MNTVHLSGNLTRDPEVRFTGGGTPVCSCSVALNHRWKDSATGEWKDKPTFVEFVIWGKRGEAFAQHHKKGDYAILASGRLELQTWDDKTTGQKRSKLHVVVEDWEFAGRRREAPADAESAPSNASTPPAIDEDSTPF